MRVFMWFFGCLISCQAGFGQSTVYDPDPGSPTSILDDAGNWPAGFPGPNNDPVFNRGGDHVASNSSHMYVRDVTANWNGLRIDSTPQGSMNCGSISIATDASNQNLTRFTLSGTVFAENFRVGRGGRGNAVFIGNSFPGNSIGTFQVSTIGETSLGVVEIYNGYSITSSAVRLGENGNGRIDVNGVGSKLNAGSLVLANNSTTAVLNVLNGGRVSTGEMIVGRGNSTSQATVNVGSAYLYSDDFRLGGAYKRGILNIESDSKLEFDRFSMSENGTLNWTLDPTDFNEVKIYDTAFFNGEMRLSLMTSLLENQSIRLFAAASVSGTFDSFSLQGSDGVLEYRVGDGLYVSNLTAVPEANSAFALAALGVLALVKRRYRKIG